MKKALVVLVSAGLVAGALVSPAVAGKSKKVKPIATTLYAHGDSAIGNQDTFGSAPTFSFLKLDGTAPTGTSSKQLFFVDAGAGGTGTPNTNCAGNALWPVFVGNFAGHVVGDMKFTFGVTSAPGSVEVRVWPDINAQACNDAYVEPPANAKTMVALPGGPATVTAEFKGVDFTAAGAIMVQITPMHATPQVGEIRYDSTADPTKLELTCIPVKGQSSCIPN